MAVPGFRHRHPGRQLAHLEARHRAHARVEDRIRCGKDTGFGRFPSRTFAINAVWLELALAGIDLLAWTQTILVDGELARCEPKALRYRLLHVARPDHPRTAAHVPAPAPALALGTSARSSLRLARPHPRTHRDRMTKARP